MNSEDTEAQHAAQVLRTMQALEDAQEKPFEMTNIPRIGQLAGAQYCLFMLQNWMAIICCTLTCCWPCLIKASSYTVEPLEAIVH